MQTRLFGTDREDTKAARVFAAGGCLIAKAALAGAWLALPSLLTEQQLSSAGILALFAFFATSVVSMAFRRSPQA